MRELVKRAKDGDLGAVSQLVDSFQDAVFGTAYALLGNFQHAQDIAQESFVRAWAAATSRFNPPTTPAGLIVEQVEQLEGELSSFEADLKGELDRFSADPSAYGG